MIRRVGDTVRYIVPANGQAEEGPIRTGGESALVPVTLERGESASITTGETDSAVARAERVGDAREEPT
jgi:hypothetical protein